MTLLPYRERSPLRIPPPTQFIRRGAPFSLTLSVEGGGERSEHFFCGRGTEAEIVWKFAVEEGETLSATLVCTVEARARVRLSVMLVGDGCVRLRRIVRVMGNGAHVESTIEGMMSGPGHITEETLLRGEGAGFSIIGLSNYVGEDRVRIAAAHFSEAADNASGTIVSKIGGMRLAPRVSMRALPEVGCVPVGVQVTHGAAILTPPKDAVTYVASRGALYDRKLFQTS